MTSEKPILILGATGSFGGALARELLGRGRPVRALVRDVDKARRRFGDAADLTLVAGDVQDAAAVRQAAAGCAVLVHGVNYPYDQWFPYMERATANVVAAARHAGASIVFPGNIYNLGNHPERPLTENALDDPCTRKGRLRAAIEASLRQAATDGPRVLIVRAGNYFGPTARNGMVDLMFGTAARGAAIKGIGRLDIAQQWAYLPDLARATADLMDKWDDLAPFQVVNFAGAVFDSLGVFYRRVAELSGHPGLAIRRLPWWLLRCAALFDGVLRELLEMRYLWDNTIILDGGLMRRLLPSFAPTPLDRAIADTLASYAKDRA